MNRPEEQLQRAVVSFLNVTAPGFPWHRLDRSAGEDGCWLWTGGTGGFGYGLMKRPGTRRNVNAHRLAYEVASGAPVPKSLVVRHRCDNPLCCNPRHLLPGSQAENIADARERGRFVPPPIYHGEEHPRAKLTAAAAREARARHLAGEGCALLARAFGVGETTMGHLLAGRTWVDA